MLLNGLSSFFFRKLKRFIFYSSGQSDLFRNLHSFNRQDVPEILIIRICNLLFTLLQGKVSIVQDIVLRSHGMPAPVDELILFSRTTEYSDHQDQASNYVCKFIQNQ